MLKQIQKLIVTLEGSSTGQLYACTLCRTMTMSNGNYSLNRQEMNSLRLKSVESTRLEGPKVCYTTTAKPLNVAKRKMAKLTEQERSEQLQPLLDAGWSMVNGRDAIYKEYIFTDFNQSFRFMTGVALMAEKWNHHPEWFNVYNKLQVTMSTHDVGGLSAKDIRMAKYMEEEFKRFV